MLTRDQVLHIAKLSRIKLREDQVEKFQTQLSGIFDYVEQLNTVDVSNVKPTAQTTGLLNCMREDVLLSEPIAAPEELLKSSRNFDEPTHSILVPNVFE